MKTINKVNNSFNALLLAIIILLSSNNLFAKMQTPEEKGLEIAIEADRRNKGFGDTTSDLKMILKNRHGQESIRYMHNKTFEMIDDGDKTIVIFDQPRDVKGTALLSFTHKVGQDEQWLYLPALKRVKRIASNNKSGPFMGSEFAYEDISSQEVEKYTYKYLRDETLDGVDCYVIERYPVDKKSGYSKQVGWVDKKEYRSLKSEFYNRRGDLFKTLVTSKYKIFLEKFWRAGEMYMVNHKTGKTTLLVFENYAFKTGLTEKDFNKNVLKRIK